MKLYISNLTLVVDTSAIDEPEPKTEAARVAYVQDAISHVNNVLERRTGITVFGPVKDGDIRVED